MSTEKQEINVKKILRQLGILLIGIVMFTFAAFMVALLLTIVVGLGYGGALALSLLAIPAWFCIIFFTPHSGIFNVPRLNTSNIAWAAGFGGVGLAVGLILMLVFPHAFAALTIGAFLPGAGVLIAFVTVPMVVGVLLSVGLSIPSWGILGLIRQSIAKEKSDKENNDKSTLQDGLKTNDKEYKQCGTVWKGVYATAGFFVHRSGKDVRGYVKGSVSVAGLEDQDKEEFDNAFSVD